MPRSPTTPASRRAALGGRPGVRSARYAGLGRDRHREPGAADPRGRTSTTTARVAYVCALAYVDVPTVRSTCSRAAARASSPAIRGGAAASATTRRSSRATLDPADDRTMAELSDDEKHAICHRGRAARAAGRAPRHHCRRPARPRSPVVIRTKTGAATLSVASNSVLIALKIAAGAITGSIAIITEALHSAIDLMASVVALVSVRKADEPADAEHPYGHERVENLAAAIEGMLILVGAGVIVYEATRRLANGEAGLLSDLGIGIAVIAFSAVVNACVALFLRRRAQELSSPALEGDAAHLGTDALTSVGVLVGLRAGRDHRRAGLRRDRRPLRRRGHRLLRHPHPHPLRPRARRRGAARRGPRPDRGRDRRASAGARPRSPDTTSSAPGDPAPTCTSTSTCSSAPAPAWSVRTHSPTGCATRSRTSSRAPRC